MRSLFLLLFFSIVVIGAGFFLKGYANSVNLNHVCGMQVPWYEAAFLETVKDKTSCLKYQ